MQIVTLKRPWIKSQSQGKRYNPDPFYQSSEWKAVRKAKLTKDPYCECEQHKGMKVKADVVDHILRIKAGGSKTDMSNLQSLTNKCHAIKSAKEANELRR